VDIVHFPLHPDTPAEGAPLVELFGGGQIGRTRLEEGHARLKAMADAEGLPLSRRSMTYNSRLAQELGLWAESKGKGDDFHMAAYQAYFVDNRNLAENEVLVELAVDVGLEAAEAATVLEERSFSDALDEHWSRALGAGVQVIPTFAAGGQRAIGAEPYDVLEKLVVAAGAKRRSPDGEDREADRE
jgi:predicted DsbA family dithiol-disulfide isomerase